MNAKQKKQVDKLTQEHKIQNFVDPKDIVAFGYSSGKDAIGDVYHIKNKGYHNLVGQHRWSGYEFDEQGHLKIEDLAFSEINADYKKASAYAAKDGLSEAGNP